MHCYVDLHSIIMAGMAVWKNHEENSKSGQLVSDRAVSEGVGFPKAVLRLQCNYSGTTQDLQQIQTPVTSSAN